MSCSLSNSPINLSDNNSGTCDLKCKYMFKYNDSSTTITNKGDYLSLSYDKPNVEPVIYNSKAYHVDEIRIFKPSLHTYNNSNANAELIIIHVNEYNEKLLVCIPIGIDREGPLEDILLTASKFANSKGKKTFMTKTINLNNLIPFKQMYVYKGSLPFSPCNGENTIIAFDKKAYIPISQVSFNMLKDMIYVHKIKVKDNNFFINKTGPKSLSTDNEIYIDCKPMSDDGETIDTNTEEIKSSMSDVFTKINYDSIINSIYFQILISLLSAFIIYKFFIFIIRKTTSIYTIEVKPTS